MEVTTNNVVEDIKIIKPTAKVLQFAYFVDRREARTKFWFLYYC